MTVLFFSKSLLKDPKKPRRQISAAAAVHFRRTPEKCRMNIGVSPACVSEPVQKKISTESSRCISWKKIKTAPILMSEGGSTVPRLSDRNAVGSSDVRLKRRARLPDEKIGGTRLMKKKGGEKRG